MSGAGEACVSLVDEGVDTLAAVGAVEQATERALLGGQCGTAITDDAVIDHPLCLPDRTWGTGRQSGCEMDCAGQQLLGISDLDQEIAPQRLIRSDGPARHHDLFGESDTCALRKALRPTAPGYQA